jgi:hypothetical protein
MGAGFAIFRQDFRLPPRRFASLLSRAHTSPACRRLLLAALALLSLTATAQTPANLTAPWQPLGPNAILSPTYGNLTGRVTALALDPNDTSGNTLYLGATGGGVWKSTNAAGPLAAVTFAPLTDTLPVFSPNAGTGVVPSLSIGALAVQPAPNPVLLAGTGDPNNATDSYYGEGLLRSTDGGLTWTLIQGSHDGANGNHSFIGLATAALAFSTTTPTLAVAAFTSSPQSAVVNATNTASIPGLYYSTDAGVTWQMATVEDGTTIVQQPQPLGTGQVGNPVTAVAWNPLRGLFFAAVRSHGYYSSPDGITWTRLSIQPGTNLTTANCPSATASANCPIFRGALAVQPVAGDLYALTVDASNLDQGLWQDLCDALSGTCASPTPTFATRIDNAALETSQPSTVLPQAAYNLTLSAAPAAGNTTLLFAGTVDLYRCSIAANSTACTLRNTTNVLDGCNAPAKVFSAEHALATLSQSTGNPFVFLGNDGGLWRSLDGVAETGSVCAATDKTHFDNLNAAIASGGSLALPTGLAQHPTAAGTLLAGLGAIGSAATTTASAFASWLQLSAGEGGYPLLDPATPTNWYITIGSGVNLSSCTLGGACTAASFAAPATIGGPQVAYDTALLDAPSLLDPASPTILLTGTCRVWRGPAQNAAAWSSANALSHAFDKSATPCTASSPLIRSLAAGGPGSGNPATSQVIYAGLAGAFDGGATLPGHLFSTQNANAATPTWTDTALPNAGQFDVSSLVVDPHDATGATVYATIQGFNVPHLYRSTNFGATWTNLSANLPNAPANAVAVDPNDANTVYIALDAAVYVTQAISTCPTTNCWSVLGTALPNAPVVALATAANLPTGDGRNGLLRAATYGRGLWQTPLLTAASPAKPAITITPASLTFASQPVSTQSAAQTITVTSSGNAPVTFTTPAITGDFTISANTCTGSLAVNASCTLSIVFAPTATGAGAGLLTIYANIAGGQATVALSGTATTPASIVFTPGSLTYIATLLNQTTAAQTITVANTGGSPATLQTPAITGDFAIYANTCTATLASSTACAISITFTPTASGTRSGTLSLTDSAGTQTAQLTGTGNSPATDTLSPLALTFATQQITTTSAAQQVTLTNAGGVALTLIAASVSPGDFAVANGCGASLAANSTCALSVTFTPTATGTRTATLTVADQFRTQTIALTGTGAAPPGVSLTPTTLTFAATGVGLASPAQTLTLTNNGGLPLTLAAPAIAANFNLAANTCSTTLAVSASCTLQIVFSPTTPGPLTGVLTLTANAASTAQTLSQTVTLAGTAIDFTLAASGPTTATLASGSDASYALLLSSLASLSGDVAFSCTGVPANATCLISPATPQLGQTVNISIVIDTGVAHNLRPARPFTGHAAPIVLAMMAPLGLLCLRRRRFRAGDALHACALAAFTLLLTTLTACGTGRYIPGSSTPVATPTPSGTYNLTVTGSTAGVSHSVGLTLIVQ